MRFAIPYKRYAFLNIFFNILYALFSGLAFMSLIPMMQVLFDPEDIKVTEKPVYTGITNIKDYAENSLNYFITKDYK